MPVPIFVYLAGAAIAGPKILASIKGMAAPSEGGGAGGSLSEALVGTRPFNGQDVSIVTHNALRPPIRFIGPSISPMEAGETSIPGVLETDNPQQSTPDTLPPVRSRPVVNDAGQEAEGPVVVADDMKGEFLMTSTGNAWKGDIVNEDLR